MHILVAEDNKTSQAVVRAMLAKLGHGVNIVSSGLDAIEAVRTADYDLVFMDVLMPGMDGLAATRGIRALPGPAGRIPVIALTADVSLSRHERYIEAGAKFVLVKPLTLRTLSAAIARVQAP